MALLLTRERSVHSRGALTRRAPNQRATDQHVRRAESQCEPRRASYFGASVQRNGARIVRADISMHVRLHVCRVRCLAGCGARTLSSSRKWGAAFIDARVYRDVIRKLLLWSALPLDLNSLSLFHRSYSVMRCVV
eukprot:IDg19445t1